MGCVCGRQCVVIQGQKFQLQRQIGEGCIEILGFRFGKVRLFLGVLVMYLKRRIQLIVIDMQ
jgi:hypothetical protein